MANVFTRIGIKIVPNVSCAKNNGNKWIGNEASQREHKIWPHKQLNTYSQRNILPEKHLIFQNFARQTSVIKQTSTTFSTFVHLTIYHLDGSLGEAAWEIVRCPSVSVHGSLSCHAHLLLAHSLKLAPTSISTSSLVWHCIRSLWCGFVGHLTHLHNQPNSSDNILNLHICQHRSKHMKFSWLWRQSNFTYSSAEISDFLKN